MSTSLLYHALGLKTYEYLRTEYLNGAIFFMSERKKERSTAPIAEAAMWSVPAG